MMNNIPLPPMYSLHTYYSSQMSYYTVEYSSDICDM